MGNPEPGKNFSSPNAKNHPGTYIISIKRGESTGTVMLSDGSSFFVSPHCAADLYVGLYITAEELYKLDEYHKAKRKAIELAARCEHSRYQLQVKLQKRAFSYEIIETVLDKLQEKNILDDYRFAEMWVHSRIRRRPEGYAALKAGLIKKRVDRAIIQQVLDEQLTEDVIQDTINRALQKIERRTKGDNKKSIKALQRRGFTMEQIRNIIPFNI